MNEIKESKCVSVTSVHNVCVSWQHTEDIAGHGSHSKLITAASVHCFHPGGKLTYAHPMESLSYQH